jgi:hypothetical protein
MSHSLIVYPDAREVHVLEASGSDRILRDTDLMETPELLPEFCVPIAEFFE